MRVRSCRSYWRFAGFRVFGISAAGALAATALVASSASADPPAPGPANFSGPVVQIQPPPGSVPEPDGAGGYGYNLPPGAVGIEFHIPATGSTGRSISSVAVGASALPAPIQANETRMTARRHIHSRSLVNARRRHGQPLAIPANGGIDCYVVPSKPTVAYYSIGFFAKQYCTGNVGGVSYLDVGVCGQIQGAQGDWYDTNCNQNDTYSPTKFGYSISTSVQHFCAAGQTHGWRTRANGHVIYNGTLYASPQEYASDTLKCVQ